MSKESYIAGFAKVAEAYGVDPVALMKIAQYGYGSDGYFNYDLNKVDDIYYELDPELEQRMSDISRSHQPAAKQPTTWRKYVPKDSGKMPVRTRAVPEIDPEKLWKWKMMMIMRARQKTSGTTGGVPKTSVVKGVNTRPMTPWVKRVGSILKKAR